jgi:hypothetical protein
MARLFLSHAYADQELAREIERRLRDAGHEVSIPVGTLPAGKWRDKLWRALESSDVLVALLSENGLGSPYVASEIGAAGVVDRARGMLVLPILFRDSGDIPLFVSDYACFRLASKEKVSLDALVGELCKAIEQHSVATLGAPKIFVSHRHKDEPQARALLELLQAAFEIKKEDIRCTSVPPYKLDAGDKTSERLRAEIAGAEVVLGLLSPDTSESKYVLAELGAAWGVGVATFPLLLRGARFEDVPEPLNERHSLSLERGAECFQLIQDLRRVTSLTAREGVESSIYERVERLAELASAKGAD